MKTVCGGWQNYYISGTRVETNNTNDMTLQAHFEIPGAPTPVVVATFSGVSSVLLTAGKDLQLCDEIPASAFGLTEIPAGTDVYCVSEVTVATVGQNFIRTISSSGQNAESGSDEGGWFGPTTATAVGTGGALTVPGGGSSTSTLYFPSCVLGRFKTPQPSAILFGSSLVTGQADNPGYGGNGGGFYPRGLYNVGSGRAIGWARQAYGGTAAHQAVGNTTKQAKVWAYATHFICELGSNDGSQSRTPAQTMTAYRSIWAAAKAAGVTHVTQQLCANRCPTSTDGWATPANMTPLAGFETGGSYKDPLNTLLLAEVGTNGLDALLDIAPNWADATLTDRIIGGRTGDGVHPNPTGHAAIAPSLATAAASWTV
ncbi:SGNH/GDSL hydrolase family protein [Macromonas nakdongensis]|uniref:SGNH/GDSL hydrolase family protein n=1 Tax=Macromonas nakdongensis TaxID=1843082 RepID=UPI0012FF4723|nr:SGNH/GDSL hydrolase family protein [Macromonas nakdongensis]